MSMSTQQTATTPAPAGRRVSTRTLVVVGLLVSLVLAGVVSFYASGHPDGLEFVAEKTGFLSSASDPATADSPFADYATKGIDNPRLSGALAGVVGCAVVLVVAGGLFMLLRRRGPSDDSTNG
jgi:hypothetical protein